MRDARTLAHLALALMLVLLSAVLGCAAGNAGSDDGLSAAPGLPVPSRNPVPIRGADVSMLDQLERQGAVFRQADGTATELLPLLQQSGVNWVRLRLWHQPVNAADVWDGGRLVSRAGEPVGGGNNDLAATVRMARRAKALGLKLLLDFHYSDFWADPAHQAKPAAWAALQGPALHEAVREHTRNALLA
ncbi:glycosyl hydrolase 53 family protein, partial [Ideonella sp.]|uniref:glycosyl hydrolase 53 family protein n=1 Tax=Ideonella sp. TaxID=1929293 RepID=UPI003BB48F42